MFVCNSPMCVCLFVILLCMCVCVYGKGLLALPVDIVLTHISDSDLRMSVVKSSTSQLRAASLTPSATFGGWSGRKTVV